MAESAPELTNRQDRICGEGQTLSMDARVPGGTIHVTIVVDTSKYHPETLRKVFGEIAELITKAAAAEQGRRL